MNRPRPMPVAEYRRNHTQGRTPAYVAQSDAATVKAAPKPARAKPKGPSPANALTAAVVELLTLLGCHCWRQNNGGVYDPTRQCFRANSSTPGISDVLGFHMATGRIVAVEVKVGADKLSLEQTDFLSRIRRAGGFAIEGRTVAQVHASFLAWQQALSQ